MCASITNMTKTKQKPTKKVGKIEKVANPKLKYETVVIDGKVKTKITYPDGTVDYRVS